MNSALAAALRMYYKANNAGDFQMAQAALGWISAEPNIGRDFKQKAGIRGDIDDSIAFLEPPHEGWFEFALYKIWNFPIYICHISYNSA